MKKLLSVVLRLAFVVGVNAQPTPDETAAASVRIALVSDTHTTRGTKNDEPLYRKRLDRVIAAVNAAKVDFVLIAGDLTQNGKPEELDDFKAQILGFQAPVYCAPGNHDVGNKRIPDKQPAPTLARLANYQEKMGPSFYAQKICGIRVLAVNSQLFGSALPQEETMWTFLEKELNEPAAAAAPVVVFMHMPPFVQTPDEPGGDYWNIEPEPRRRFLTLLKHGGVHTVLTGHLHFGLISHCDGIQIVTTLPVSFGLPAGVAPQGWTLVTLPRTGEAQVEVETVKD